MYEGPKNKYWLSLREMLSLYHSFALISWHTFNYLAINCLLFVHRFGGQKGSDCRLQIPFLEVNEGIYLGYKIAIT